MRHSSEREGQARHVEFVLVWQPQVKGKASG